MQCSFLLWILVHRLKWINHGCWSKLSEIIGAIFRENNCCISSWKKCIKLKIITAILSYFHLNLAFNVMDFFFYITRAAVCPLCWSQWLFAALCWTQSSLQLSGPHAFPSVWLIQLFSLFQIRIWARRKAIDEGQGAYALEKTGPILSFFEKYYKIPYPLKKSGENNKYLEKQQQKGPYIIQKWHLW